MEISKKIIGFALLALGVGLIVWALYSSYNIFTGKTNLPEVFQAPQIQITSSDSTSIESQLKKAVQEQLSALIPSDYLTRILNFSVWSFFVFIVIFGGNKISDIGIKLLKKEN